MAQLIVGDVAPQFDLPRDDGGMVSLSALAGRPAVLFFYPKDDTSSCTVEAQEFSGLQPEFDRAGVALFGISPDPLKKHQRFKAKYQLTVDLLADPDHGALQAYGVWGQKSMFGVSYMGVERTTFLLRPDLKIERIWRKVRVKGHAQEVLDAARALTSEPEPFRPHGVCCSYSDKRESKHAEGPDVVDDRNSHSNHHPALAVHLRVLFSTR